MLGSPESESSTRSSLLDRDKTPAAKGRLPPTIVGAGRPRLPQRTASDAPDLQLPAAEGLSFDRLAMHHAVLSTIMCWPDCAWAWPPPRGMGSGMSSRAIGAPIEMRSGKSTGWYWRKEGSRRGK